MILIVEDEIQLATLLSDYLNQSHMNSHCIHDGNEVMPWLNQHNAKLIVLDLMLPGRDGLSLCREIRATSNVPIIITTAKVEEIDRLLGLELGADDYICKPYSPREVVARVKAVLRRSELITASNDSSAALPIKSPYHIALDDNRLTLTIRLNQHQQAIEFTLVEYHLIKMLVNKPGLIFSRNQLMQNMYSDNRIVSDRTIDSHIKKIRKKLRDVIDEREWIQSVYGAGYRFDPTAE